MPMRKHNRTLDVGKVAVTEQEILLHSNHNALTGMSSVQKVVVPFFFHFSSMENVELHSLE